MRRASLCSPLEREVIFAVRAVAHLGPAVDRRRKRSVRLLQRLAGALDELDDYALRQRHMALEGAPGLRPVFVAFARFCRAWLGVAGLSWT